MKKHELVSSLVWMAVGLLFLTGSAGLGLGKLGEPGPGLFPFVMAACLVSFSSVHFISSLRKGVPSSLSTGERFWPQSDGLKRILLTIILLFGFVFTLNYLGFVLTAFLFMFIVLRFVEPQRWLTVLLIGSLTTALSYLVFKLWLRSNLPVGFLGF
jgi:putative tricarboxylic transport membrane protein